ncbi:MAG: spore cortex biosynthesis protein YabQ, partial [Intestinibacillus sp.]
MGVALGVFYDLLRAVRRSLNAGVALTALCDTLFWMGTLGTIFVFVLTIAAGEGRSYVLLGAAMGALLYFIALSPPILALLMLLVRFILYVAAFPGLVWKKVKPHLEFLKKYGTAYKKQMKNLKKLFHFPVKR